MLPALVFTAVLLGVQAPATENRSLSLRNAYAARRVGLVGGRGKTKRAVLQARPEVVEQPSKSAVKALLVVLAVAGAV